MDTATAEVKEMPSAAAAVDAAASQGNRLTAFIELTKPRIAFLLVLTSAAGFYLGSGAEVDYVRFLNAMIGITLLAFGVATLNQFIERDLDMLMERTARRPLPTGRVTPREALIFGIAQCVAAELYILFLVNPLTALLGLLVIVGYVLMYTPMKTRTSVSTAVGAIPGALPPLMGWTAAADQISITAWALFVMQFLWQFPHFLAIAWMYREQYAKAGIKMLPVVEPEGRITARQIVMFTIMLVPVSLAPTFFGLTGTMYLAGALLLGIGFLYASVRAARSKSDRDARSLLLVSVIYLPLLFVLMVADKL
ncbi:MAG: heme o synthase [Pyrinomonadaceae bacterium]